MLQYLKPKKEPKILVLGNPGEAIKETEEDIYKERIDFFKISLKRKINNEVNQRNLNWVIGHEKRNNISRLPLYW